MARTSGLAPLCPKAQAGGRGPAKSPPMPALSHHTVLHTPARPSEGLRMLCRAQAFRVLHAPALARHRCAWLAMPDRAHDIPIVQTSKRGKAREPLLQTVSRTQSDVARSLCKSPPTLASALGRPTRRSATLHPAPLMLLHRRQAWPLPGLLLKHKRRGMAARSTSSPQRLLANTRQ